MKKLVCFLMAVCLLFTQGIALAAAENTSAMVGARDVISGGQGVGYYDNGMNGGTENLENVPTSSICLRGGGEWAKYDISALHLKAGTYTLKVNYVATVSTYFKVYVDVLLDDVLRIKKDLTKTGDTLLEENAVESDFGYIYISGVTQTITLKNSGAYSMFIKNFKLDYVSTDNLYNNTVYYDGQNITNTPNIVTDAVDNTAGIDYYDDAGKAFTNNAVSSLLCVVQHAKDWSGYDISALPAGTYELVANTANTSAVTLGISIDNNFKISNAAVSATGSYDTFASTTLGNIYISSGSSALKIGNVGSNSVYLRYFTLKFLSATRTIYPTIRLQAENVIAGGQNVGFFDSTGSALETSPSGTGTTVCLRNTEWIKYDVSKLEWGTYAFRINRASKLAITFDISMGNAVQFTGVTLPLTNAANYDTFLSGEMGYIYIPANATTITVKNTSGNAAFIDYFELAFIGDKNTSAYQKQTEAVNVILLNSVRTHDYSWHDAGGAQLWEINAANVVVRENDWFRYDISTLEAGTYTVKARIGNKFAGLMGVSVDGTAQIAPVSVAATGEYTTYAMVNLGKVKIGQGAQSIQFTGGATSNAMYFLNFILERSALTLETDFTSDSAGNTAVNSLSTVIDGSGNGTVYAKVNIENHDYSDSYPFAVIVAAYNGNEIVSVEVYPQTLSSNTIFTHIYPVMVKTGYTVKTILWDNLNRMQPLKQAKVIN